MKRLSALFLLALLLSGCQSTMDAEVTHYNALSAPVAGRTVAVGLDQGQNASLEFDHFAQMVLAALQSQGMTPLPPSTPEAQVVALIHYGNAGSRTDYFYDAGPPMGWGPGWGPHYGWTGWGGWGPGEMHGYTVYARWLEVQLVDGPAWRSGQRKMLWQGRAVGDSTIRDINGSMPALVQALFQTFPGASGQTVRVSVPIER